MEKVKIGFDEAKKNFLEYQIRGGIEAINNTLKKALAVIGFELTPDTLKDCYSGCIATLRIYHERLETDLAAISTPSTRAMLQKNAAEAFENFNATVKTALDKVSDVSRGYISIVDGFAVFTEESQQKLLEDCAIYLSDPEEIELYSRHIAAVEALNNFFQGHRTVDWHKLFEWNEGKFTPAQANYTYINQRIKQLKNN